MASALPDRELIHSPLEKISADLSKWLRAGRSEQEKFALLRDIRDNGGIKVPLLGAPLRGHPIFETDLIDGYERYKIAGALGLLTVPIYRFVRPLTAGEAAIVALTVNTRRENHDAIALAEVCDILETEAGRPLLLEELADKTGFSLSAISKGRKTRKNASDKLIALARANELRSWRAVYALCALPHKEQEDLAAQAVEKDWDLAQIEAAVKAQLGGTQEKLPAASGSGRRKKIDTDFGSITLDKSAGKNLQATVKTLEEALRLAKEEEAKQQKEKGKK